MTKMTTTRGYRQAIARPTVEVSWQENFGINELGREVALLTTSDISNNAIVGTGEAQIQHTVLAQPMVARTTNSSPRMSLTFLLSREPKPDESELKPLIEGAVIGIDLTIAPEPALLESLTVDGNEYRSLFPRQTTFRLTDDERSLILAETTVNNGQATASLSVTLKRSLALELLTAVNGQTSSLQLNATIEYITFGAIASSLKFTTNLVDVYEFLARATESDRVLYEVDLRNYMAQMLGRIISIENMSAENRLGIEEIASAALPKFLRAVSYLFESSDENLATDELGQRYILRSSPPPSTNVRFTLRPSELVVSGKLDLRVSMEQFMTEAIRGQELETLLHFVVFDEQGKVSPLPRHTQTKVKDLARSEQKATLAAVNNSVVSLSQAIRPTTLNPMVAHSVLATQPLHNRLSIVALDNLAIAPASQSPGNLPIVRNQKELLWRDRLDTNRYWYSPEFVVVMPETNSQAATSPFLFSFRTVGHDLQGRPALEGTIRLTLHQEMPEKVKRKLSEMGSIRARPVPTKNLSVALRIPFRDHNGQERKETCRASSIEVERDRVIATFRLANDWVRVCYGALAYADFQSSSAEVAVGYSFDAYVPIKNQRLEILFGGKSLRLPLANTAKEKKQLRDRLYVDAANGTIHFPGAELRLLPLKKKPRRQTTATISSASLLPSVQAATLPIVRPELQIATPVVEMLKLEKYALNTQVHRTKAEILFPCNKFGGLYVEVTAEGDRLLGCQEAFKLGETQYRLYQELPIDNSNYRVYRSLPTPDRFVVVPKVYAIGRFEPSQGDKAYRPLALLYSTIDDLDNLKSSRCVIMATLQPDIPVFERVWLLDELRQNYHPNPILDYFTELEGEITCDWVLANSDLLRLEAKATRLPDSFEVSLITDAIGVPQLQAIMQESGVKGVATLVLTDGTKFETTLNLQLSHIVGPWEAGPLEITKSRDNQLKLKNRIESTVNISEVLIPQANSPDSISLNSRLEPGEEIATAATTAASAIVPVYSLEAQSLDLTEIRSFIEDIAVNVLLVNRLDFGALSLKEVEITAKIQNLAGTARAKFTLSAATVASLEFLLPLTVFYENPMVEFQGIATDTGDRARQISFPSLELGTGIIFEVTEELLG